MAITRQYFPRKITFDSVEYDNSDEGGPLEVIDSENPEVISDKTGADIYPTFTEPVGYTPTVFIKVRDRENMPTRGATSDLICHATTSAGNRKRTYANMVFIGCDSSLIRAQPGETVWRFDHQSADGTTIWYSDAADE